MAADKAASDLQKLLDEAEKLFQQGKYHRALEVYNRRLALARESKNTTEETNTLGQIAAVYISLEELPKADFYFKRAQELADTTPDFPRADYATLLSDLSRFYHKQDEKYKALAIARQALALVETQEDALLQEAAVRFNLASLYLNEAESDEAEKHVERAALLFRQIGKTYSEAVCYNLMSAFCYTSGKLEQSEAYARQSNALLSDQDSPHTKAINYLLLAHVYIKKNNNYKALELYLKALAMLEVADDQSLLGDVFNQLGVVYNNIHDYPRSKQYLEKALNFYRLANNTEGEAHVLCSLSEMHRKTGEIKKAIGLAEKALEKLPLSHTDLIRKMRVHLDQMRSL